MPKTIQLTIPDACIVPEIIATFSPEEVFLMLKIGSDCLREGRNALAGMSQIEIYNKIKDESKEEVKKMELDLVVQREMTLQMEEKIRTMYTGQVEQIKRQLDITRDQLKNYEAENRGVVQKEVEKIREKYDLFTHIEKGENPKNFYPIIDNVSHKYNPKLWFDTYEETELACLEKLIEIVESKSE